MEAFRKLDKDNSGYLDKDELRCWLKRKDQEWTEEDEMDLDDLFQEVDTDGNGKVEFSGELRYNIPHPLSVLGEIVYRVRTCVT